MGYAAGDGITGYAVDKHGADTLAIHLACIVRRLEGYRLYRRDYGLVDKAVGRHVRIY